MSVVTRGWWDERLSAKEAASALGVPPPTMYRWLQDMKVEHDQALAGTYTITGAQLRRFLDSDTWEAYR